MLNFILLCLITIAGQTSQEIKDLPTETYPIKVKICEGEMQERSICEDFKPNTIEPDCKDLYFTASKPVSFANIVDGNLRLHPDQNDVSCSKRFDEHNNCVSKVHKFNINAFSVADKTPFMTKEYQITVFPRCPNKKEEQKLSLRYLLLLVFLLG